MIDLQNIKWRNRFLAVFPIASRLNELRHLYNASRSWRSDGWTAPVPYFVRRAMLLSEARAMGATTFVETGTFLGDTTIALSGKFSRVHTIEVEPTLASLARARFAGRPSITVHEGDSAALLPDLCRRIETPCLFYLDGHYSGGYTGKGEKECPAIEELSAIFTHTRQPFRIIMDDARLFGTDPSYPALSEVRAFLERNAPDRQMRIENDAIIIS